VHLRSITLKGFKSFPDRTRLEFSSGVSVVVGPNGSGKSNITDAVLWALGEQSPLAVRGQSMQDVIFAGAHGVQARAEAEVEVVLDNGDGAVDLPAGEVAIARRLDRAGEGEYRVNGAKCRLVDVLEILSDTGLGKEMHSVVSQGRVEQIVTSKPRDRRLLVEEAAGLGKHRKRRRRAQLKLERTEDNLDRALDVEREARSRLRPLKRTAEWGRLTALRAAHERLSVRSEALVVRRAELAAELDRQRAALGALAEEAASAADDSGDPVGAGLRRIGSALDEATQAHRGATHASNDGDRANEVARIRDAAERAASGARRVEGMLGKRRQDSLEGRIVASTAVVGKIDVLLEVGAGARDAVGERATALERQMLDCGDAEDFTVRLRECSQAESGLQSRLHATGEAVTEAEVRAAHLRDRRDEASAGLERVARTLGREVEAASAALDTAEREEIERKLERLARRRETLGPVNPLAEREYADALEHVEQLAEQRADLEAALAELDGLITDTDRKIRSAFEETFEATQRNFEELVEHLFPGGRGRLRLVDERTPKLVLGGASEDDTKSDEPEPDERDAARGVEIEVTPAGKATRKLSLLSGGEKALVALAFVFSVFLARPSPCYILFEAEAALDDANIDPFLQLVRRVSDRAQFVIVTHQKRTMDAADVLYGVSMGKGGITKVISRRLTQADESAGAAEAAEAA